MGYMLLHTWGRFTKLMLPLYISSMNHGDVSDPFLGRTVGFTRNTTFWIRSCNSISHGRGGVAPCENFSPFYLQLLVLCDVYLLQLVYQYLMSFLITDLWTLSGSTYIRFINVIQSIFFSFLKLTVTVLLINPHKSLFQRKRRWWGGSLDWLTCTWISACPCIYFSDAVNKDAISGLYFPFQRIMSQPAVN